MKTVKKPEVKIVKKFRGGDDFEAIVECEGKTFKCLDILDYGLAIVEIDNTGKRIETPEGAELKKYIKTHRTVTGLEDA